MCGGTSSRTSPWEKLLLPPGLVLWIKFNLPFLGLRVVFALISHACNCISHAIVSLWSPQIPQVLGSLLYTHILSHPNPNGSLGCCNFTLRASLKLTLIYASLNFPCLTHNRVLGDLWYSYKSCLKLILNKCNYKKLLMHSKLHNFLLDCKY